MFQVNIFNWRRIVFAGEYIPVPFSSPVSRIPSPAVLLGGVFRVLGIYSCEKGTCFVWFCYLVWFYWTTSFHEAVYASVDEYIGCILLTQYYRKTQWSGFWVTHSSVVGWWRYVSVLHVIKNGVCMLHACLVLLSTTHRRLDIKHLCVFLSLSVITAYW